MQTLTEQSHPELSPWPDIAPLLNTAMAELNGKDHSAIVLRFFEGKSMEQIGCALGVNEDAAKTRVSRAVEKLRKFFVKRGLALSAEGIAGAISANAVQAAPATLSKTATSLALAKGITASPSTISLIKGAVKLMTWAKVKTAVVVGSCALLIGTGTVAFNNLTDKSIRGIPPGWSVVQGEPSAWRWFRGKIVGRETTGDSLLLSGQEYGDVTMSVVVDAGPREASLAVRMQDIHRGYTILFVPGGTPWAKEHPSYINLAKRYLDPHGNYHEDDLASFHGSEFDEVGRKAKLEVTARGPFISVRLNGRKILNVKDSTYATGRIGFKTTGYPDAPSDAAYSKLIIN